jgi:type IV secretory pathway VirB2 component (pilin)
MKKTLTTSLLSLLILLTFGTLAYAQTDKVSNPSNPTDIVSNPGSTNTKGIPNPFAHGDSLMDLLNTIINKILMPIGGIVAVLAFIFVGFKFVLAQGNPGKIKEAREGLLYVAIGTAVLLGAWVIANVISNTIFQLQTP